MALDPFAIPGLLGFAVTWSMAAFLWMNAGDRSVNKHLAALLVVEGIAVLTTALNTLFGLGPEVFASSVLHFMADAALPPLYLLFLSHALDLPILRPLRGHAGHLSLGVLALAGPLFVLLFDERFWTLQNVPGPWLPALYAYVTSGFFLGIVAAIAALRRARTPTVRQRALWFLVAFTFFDLVWGFVYGYGALNAADTVPKGLSPWVMLLYQLAVPIFVGFLAYAILKAQLFDIDLRVKVGIRRGTIALAFLIAIVAAAEIAQTVLSEVYGLAAGGVVAGLLLLLIRPLERAADRLAHATMPNATGSPEYVAYKKIEVYRAAVESAIELDGRIDDRERSKLERLAAKLGVRPEDASAVQRDALAMMTA